MIKRQRMPLRQARRQKELPLNMTFSRERRLVWHLYKPTMTTPFAERCSDGPDPHARGLMLEVGCSSSADRRPGVVLEVKGEDTWLSMSHTCGSGLGLPPLRVAASRTHFLFKPEQPSYIRSAASFTHSPFCAAFPWPRKRVQ